MAKPNHTPGPWRVRGEPQIDQHGRSHVHVLGEDEEGRGGNAIVADCTGPDRWASAARIVACVNACEGIPDDRIDTIGAFLRSLPPRALDLLPRVIADAQRSLAQQSESTGPDGRMSMHEVAEVGEAILPLLLALVDGKDGEG